MWCNESAIVQAIGYGMSVHELETVPSNCTDSVASF